MKILFFTRQFYPHIGGVETHVLEISKRLIKDGHSVTIIAEKEIDKKKGNWHLSSLSAMLPEDLKDIKVHHILVSSNSRFKKFQIWKWLFQHKNLIKDTDIIHAHDVYFWYFPFRFLYPFKKSFVTFHGYETIFPPSKKAVIVRRLSAALARGNICVGKFIEKWYGTKADLITYGGIEPFYTRANIVTRLGELLKHKKSTKIKILFIGRLAEDTSYPQYLEVLDALREKGVEFSFESFGDGEYRVRGEAYGKVYGFVKNINKYIETSDIIFASSYLTILESMKYKKPIVAFYNNELKKDYLMITPFHEWIFIERDIQTAVNKTYSLVKEGASQEVIEKAYEWVNTQTWNNVVQLYYSLWKK